MSANCEPKNDFETQADVIYFCIKENNPTKIVSTLCLLSAQVRKQIVSIKVNENTALCVAVANGHKDIVEYLLKNCEADVNQRGIFTDENDNQYKVPPIWCAAESGRVDIASLLLFYGADVNDCSDTESTPVRCACFMNHQLMVEFLVENGGNLSKTNIYGGTCLMNSIRCSEIVEFLIAKGVEVNSADRNGWTALHYAAKEGHVNSVRILLTNNADYTIRNKTDRTALDLAAYNGHDFVVEAFMKKKCGTEIELVDSYELLGCHHVDTDIEKARKFWMKALGMRFEFSVNSMNKSQTSVNFLSKSAFADTTEITSAKELKHIKDEHILYMQALLKYRRILGEDHEDTIYKIRYRGAVYADTKLFQRCVELWKYAYSIEISRKQFLENDTVNAATSLANIFCEMQIAFEDQNANEKVQTKDVIEVISMLKDHIFSCEAILSRRPVNIQTINNYKYLLQSVIHIINVFRCLERDPYEQNDFLKIIHELVRLNTTTYDGESLLHLAVDPQTETVDDTYFSQMPSLEVVKVLLECGIDTNRSDKDGVTALLCSIKYSHQHDKK
ncbi:protein fem-1 homolog C-like [Mytilus trossulus]|uniref:protein fem-1 homolog C-like n=1 Tax=Mytilus trossulus TaxID=6551 RepID=UPI00300708D4